MSETIKVEWIRFGKFVIGAILFGVAGTLTNYAIEGGKLTLLAKEIELKELEQTGKFIVYAIDENIGTRERFAHYFARVTLSEKRRALWNSYWEEIRPDYKKLKDSEAEDSRQLSELQALETKSREQQAEIETLKARLQETRKQLIVKPVLRTSNATLRNTPQKYDYPDYYNYSGIGMSGGDIIEFDAGGDTAGNTKSAWTKWLDWKEAAKATPNPCPKGYRPGATLTREMRTTGQPPRSEIRSQVECLDRPG